MAFRIIHNDIVNMNTDAIVNTSNPFPTYAPGSDSAVYKAAGVNLLLEARQEIGYLEPGQAAITPGFHLPAKYIIHTVGPAYIDGLHGEPEALASCYRNSLAIARRKKLSSIAFPLISTGVYGYPKVEAMKIAISEISNFLIEHEMEVYLVVFDQESRRISDKLFADIDSYIDSHYVKKKLEEEYGAPVGSASAEMEESVVDAESDAIRETTIDAMPESSRREGFFNWDIIEIPEFLPARPKKRPTKKSDRKKDEVSFGTDAHKKQTHSSLSIDDLLSRKEETFSDMLLRFAREKDMKNSDVYNRAGVNRKLFSKIISKPDYHPGKKTVFALALGLGLNIDQTRDFLLRAGYAINPSDKFDLVLQYFIEREFYDVVQIDIALFEHGLPLIHE